MTDFPALARQISRNARWRVEWRRPTHEGGEPILLAHVVRGANSAREFALGLGETALAGEFRLTSHHSLPVITNLEGLRRWTNTGACPASAPRALWARELERQKAVDEFLYAIRQAAGRASAARVVTTAHGLALVRIASKLTTC